MDPLDMIFSEDEELRKLGASIILANFDEYNLVQEISIPKDMKHAFSDR